MGQPDDLTILTEIAAGDKRHFDIFVDRYKRRLFGFIFTRLRHRQEAEDITQEVFIRVFRAAKAGQFNDSNRNLTAWLFKIAVRLIIDKDRHQARRPREGASLDDSFPGSSAALADADADPATIVIRAEESQRIMQLLDMLPPEQQEVVRLKVFGQLKFRDIADIQGCSPATVKSRMRYALGHIQRGLSGGFEESKDGSAPHQ